MLRVTAIAGFVFLATGCAIPEEEPWDEPGYAVVPLLGDEEAAAPDDPEEAPADDLAGDDVDALPFLAEGAEAEAEPDPQPWEQERDIELEHDGEPDPQPW